MSSVHVVPRMRLGLALLATVALFALAGCGSSSSSSNSSSSAAGGGSSAGSSTSAAASSSGGASASGSTSSCGPKPGVKATGSPINIGAIVTHQPGTDFTDISNMEGAYFACVNANGGVNGHPVVLYQETDQTNPSQIAADAKKLVQSDHVLGMAGSIDLLECTIDAPYFKSLGIYEIDAGIAPECWSTPNSAPINLGPRYSSDGAVQYAIAHGAKKIAFDQSNVPGTGFIEAGPNSLAAASHVPIVDLDANVPITDANSVAIRDVDDAGPNGAVILNYTPPEALVILQAAQKLGLEDHVKLWGCSTPCDTDFLAKALGPKWDHKLFINSELAPPDNNNGPEFALYKAALKKYGSDVAGGIGTFSQFGFVQGEFVVKALDTIKGPYTIKSVNQAFVAAKDYKSAMMCKPWVYGNLPLHIPNNTDYTVTPHDNQMIQAEGCTAVSSADPQIAKYRSVASAAGLG
ncbi:MAG: ABC transporter substrate-binding protein [Solirubrobacteraceae bacterium]